MSEESQKPTKPGLAKEVLLGALEGLLTGGAMRTPPISVTIDRSTPTSTNGTGTTNGGESKPE